MIYIIGNDGTPQRVDGVGNELYPVGSIYMSTTNTSPASMFGGTWEQVKDRFLLGAGDTYSAGATGGSADAVVVNHSHTWQGSTTLESGHTHNDNRNWYLQVGSGSVYWSGTVYQSINNSGVDGAGKNMPPYLAVYCWKRIS